MRPGLRVMQHALAQERKSGSPIHHALDRFELVDLSLRLALAPWQPEGRFDRIVVPLDASHEAFHLGDAAAGGLRHPGAQLLVLALAHHLQEAL
jgi:hypothetical protein